LTTVGYVREGMIVLDIGANIGAVSEALMRDVGPTGAVYAIEPQAALREAFAHRCPGVRWLRAAVTDSDGMICLYHSRETPHASVYLPNVLAPTGETEWVRSVTLDSLQASGELPGRLDYIKVDTQGAEMAVLRGASQLLQRRHAAWYLEVWPFGLQQAGTSIDALCEVLAAAGLTPHDTTWDRIGEDALRLQGHASMDVLFVPRP